ncbi:MAG: transglutaminase family protein [Bacteroidales bacterium]|jgi:regulator of sirC expression with transglutaminase-like and TPR domain
MVYDKEIGDLLPLLDDPDKYVQDALFEHLKSMGDPAIAQLEIIYGQVGKEPEAVAIGKIVDALKEAMKFEKLKRWIDAGEDDLLKGLYYIQDILTVGMEITDLRAVMMDCVTEILPELRDDQTVLERVMLFNHVFFNRLNFRTIDPMFSKPDNTFIHQVLAKKRGSPVTVGLVYIMLAYQTGVPVEGCVFKGGFLPALKSEKNQLLFINVFKNGLMFPHAELETFLKSMHLNIPADSFREALPVDLAQIYAETLLFSYSAPEQEDYNPQVDRLNRILALFGREKTMLIEVDDEEDDM